MISNTMINKDFNELTKLEKELLQEVRIKIMAGFNSIIDYNGIDLTSSDEDDFPLSDKQLEQISYSVSAGIYWESVKEYIKTALVPTKQEAWHDGELEEVWYKWELHYLPLEKMFKMFKEHHKKTQKELFGK